MKEGIEEEYIMSVNVWIVYSMLQFETMIYFLALPLPWRPWSWPWSWRWS